MSGGRLLPDHAGHGAESRMIVVSTTERESDHAVDSVVEGRMIVQEGKRASAFTQFATALCEKI